MVSWRVNDAVPPGCTLPVVMDGAVEKVVDCENENEPPDAMTAPFTVSEYEPVPYEQQIPSPKES